MIREELIENYFIDVTPEESPIFYDGFDEAIIGVAQRIGLTTVIAYDADKMVEIMINRDGMTEEEAIEYFDYNIIGSYLGPNTPIFIKKELL